MGNKRREFTPEYKDEAVKLVVNTGRPVATVAGELGIVEQTLGNWVKAYRARHEARDEALTEAERAELVRLRKEVAELKMDRVFLKKPPSSSPRKRRIRTGSVRADAGGEKQLHGHPDGPAARGLQVRVLCLARADTLQPSGASGADRAEGDVVPRRLGRDLRVAEDPCRPPRRWGDHFPINGRESHAPAVPAWDLPETVADHHGHRPRRRSPGGRGETTVGYRGAEPGLGGRHHLPAHFLDSKELSSSGFVGGS